MGASAAVGRPLRVMLGLAGLGLAADQLSKYLALRFLRPGEPRPLLGDWVRLTLTHNRGSAFGLVASSSLLLIVGVAVCLGVLWYVIWGRALARRPSRAAGLGLVLGGSLGNLADRIRSRAVTDFLDLRVWPVFNVADIAITAGLALLALKLLRGC